MEIGVILLATTIFSLIGCTSATSLKEYGLNSSAYVGNNITINNKVGNYGSPDVEILQKYGTNTNYYKFIDDEGYYVNVITKVRTFEMGKEYSVSGTFIKTSYGNYYLIEK